MDRRKFLKKSVGAALSASLASSLVPALAQAAAPAALEGEDLAKLGKALKDALGKEFKDLLPSTDVKLVLPTIAESGANVPVEIESALAMSQVKAVHCFSDKNPNPHLFSVFFGPASTTPYYATRVRIAETAPVRAILETADGKFLLASQSVRVTVGGCG
ncbi:MAG: thiosulfate oxidation carrier protein SoxY [Deinococcus sp.]|nr:thiosulfate oxidation carrier protein SoxY [Deinococcus sp.]